MIMKTLDIIQLNESGSKNIVDALQILLADLQVYYTNLRNFHWNIKGKGFFQLHDKYEEMYTSVADQVDEVAERILMLGGVPENRFSSYLQKSRVKELATVTDGEETLKHTLDALKVLISAERSILELSGDNNDEVTTGLMGGFLEEQEKQVWMLTAFLSK